MATLDPVRRKWEAWRARLAFRRFSRTNPLAAGEVGVVLQHGVGDHVLVAGLSAAISRHYQAGVVLGGRPNMRFVTELFPGVRRYVDLPPPCIGREVGESFIRPRGWAFGHFRGMELARVIGYKKMTLLDAYRCLFGLPPDAILERPRLPNDTECRAAAEFLRQRGCQPGRTLYVSRSARSTPLPAGAERLLGEVCRRMIAAGYSILENERPGAPGVKTPEIPLALLRAIVLVAGGHVTVRSGLSDLLCDLPVRGAIIYGHTPYLGGTLFDGCSVAGYGFGAPIDEYVLPQEDEAELIRVAENIVVRAQAGIVSEKQPTDTSRA